MHILSHFQISSIHRGGDNEQEKGIIRNKIALKIFSAKMKGIHC